MSRRPVFFTVLGMLSAVSLLAQAPALGPVFQVNTYTTQDQNFSKVATDSAGNFVVVWQSANNAQDGSGNGIFAQRYDSVGAVQGPEFQVNTHTTGNQSYPSVAMDPAGDFVVVWESNGQDGSGKGVFGQRYDGTGAAQGGEFQVNTTTSAQQYQPTVAMDGSGNFVVAWTSYPDGGGYGIFAQRYDSGGVAQGGEIPVNTFTSGNQFHPSVAMDASGDFVVAWDGRVQGPGSSSAYYGVAGQWFNSSGAKQGPEIVASTTIGNNPSVGLDASGNFVVVWVSDDQLTVNAQRYSSASAPVGTQIQVNQFAAGVQKQPSVTMDPTGSFAVAWNANNYVVAQRFGSGANLVGSQFQLNTFTGGVSVHPSIAMNPSGTFVVAWSSMYEDGSGYGTFARRAQAGAALPMKVDARTVTGTSSNANGVLEAGETVQVAAAWKNVLASPITLTGTASNITGPDGPVYTIDDATSNYGDLAAGASNDCFTASADCYLMTVSGARPAPHWDATFVETLSDGFTKTWALHVGESFPDVPMANNFYGFIENLFHNGITGGCGGGNYCPTSSVTRGQMAVFLLKAEHGSGFVPTSCDNIFPDVNCFSDPFAPFIEQLFHEGITGGCGGGNYCPDNPVTRAQMAVFLLKAEHGSTYVPPVCGGVFPDVTCPSQFANWIEQLYHENITGGCGMGDYCPNNPNTRGQMAVFLVKTFGLQLYGP